MEVNSTWLITSELANQRTRKVLFTCVVYANGFYCDIFAGIHATLLVFIVIIILTVATVQCCGNPKMAASDSLRFRSVCGGDLDGLLF